MMIPMRIFAPLLFLIFFVSSAFAQQSSYNVRMANLEQDVQRLSALMGRMQMQIEQLQRENDSLKANASQSYVTVSELNVALQNLRVEIDAANNQLKRDVANQVGQQLSNLAAKTQKAMKALAKTVEAQPEVVREIKFSDDFPKTGVSYTIKTGDTLSSIAKKHHSTVKDIQNANKIANPAKIQVGSVIFIPQAQ
jgi:LysM repeat protein